MIGNLLTLFTATGAFALGAVVLQTLLASRVPARVRIARPQRRADRE